MSWELTITTPFVLDLGQMHGVGMGKEHSALVIIPNQTFWFYKGKTDWVIERWLKEREERHYFDYSSKNLGRWCCI